MCQARRDGGRRCPVHRHETIARVKAVTELTDLNRRQAERLFAELRREGRNGTIMTDEERAANLQQLTEAVQDTDIAEAVKTELEKSAEHETTHDNASDYAYRIFQGRAAARSAKMNQRFTAVATRTGLSSQEVRAKFEEFFNAVDISRGAGNQDEEYGTTVRARYERGGLPYDRASIVAFEKLATLGEPERERRVTLIPAREGSHVNSFGYDAGRLEIAFNSNPDNVYAYRDVPAELWERLRDADRPGSVYSRSIRGNSDYVYLNAEEAEADAYRIRCASCGQFRANSHECPGRVVREELTTANAPVTTEEVAAIVETETAADTADESIVEADEPTEIAVDAVEDTVSHAIETSEPVPAVVAEEFVLPAANIPAYDPTAEVNEPTISDLAGWEDYAIESNPAVLPSVSAEVTAEGQSRPTPFDRSSLKVLELEWNRRDSTMTYEVLNGGHDLSYYTSYYHMDETEAQKLVNTPSHIRVIVTRENYSARSFPVKAFDSRVHVATNVGEYPVGKLEIHQIGHTVKPFTYSADDRAAAQDAHYTKINELVSSGEAVHIEAVATRTSRFNFDGNLTMEAQPNLRLGKVVQLRNVLRDGKVAVIPFTMDTRANRYGDYVDDQGYQTSVSGSIEGSVMVRRNAAGVIEVISSERALKCTCADYRRRYYCKHVNYAQRHIGNVVQQAATVSSTGGRAGIPEGTHALLSSAAIRNRSGVTVVENANEEPYINFGTEINSRSHMYVYGSRLLTLPPRLHEGATGEEQAEYARTISALSSMHTMQTQNSLAPVRAALRRSDVEVPVRANFSTSEYADLNGTVTGSLRIAKNESEDLDDLEIKSHTLKCTCAEYQEKYDCPHIRAVALQGYAALTFGRAANRWDRSSNIHTLISQRRNDDENLNIGRQILDIAQERARQVRRSATANQAGSRIYNYADQFGSFQEQAEQTAERIRLEELERQRAAAERARIEEAARQERELARLESLRAANATTVEASAKYRENMVKRWEEVDEGYSQNGKAFYEDYRAALSRKRAGEPALQFRTENVTDGICGPEDGGRRFGVELEFDIKRGVDRTTALAKIGQELHEAGLTNDAGQHAYHSAGQNGYAKWSFERDCTVDAELVSPIMRDTPEDWEQLRKATEIINRNGGIATTRTGSHVHISTASYEKSTAKHAELLREIGDNNDIMYRLASNPATGKHRGTQWCAPNVQDISEEVASDAVVTGHRVLGYSHSSHNVYLNYEGTGKDEFHKSNVEFRMWDGTLDPAVIQQQVVISAALTDYAERSVIENNGSKPRSDRRDAISAGKEREKAALTKANTQTHTEESFIESHEKVAKFFDKLFRRKEDRAAATSLLAVTNWQQG